MQRVVIILQDKLKCGESENVKEKFMVGETLNQLLKSFDEAKLAQVSRCSMGQSHFFAPRSHLNTLLLPLSPPPAHAPAHTHALPALCMARPRGAADYLAFTAFVVVGWQSLHVDFRFRPFLNGRWVCGTHATTASKPKFSLSSRPSNANYLKITTESKV